MQLDPIGSENHSLQQKGLKTRAAIIQRVNTAILVSSLSSSLAFITLSILEHTWQYLIGAASLTISGILTYPIHRAKRLNNLDAVATWMVFGITLSYCIAEFFWQGATIQIVVGCLMLIILVGSLTLSQKWYVWVVTCGVACTIFIAVNIWEPITRYDTSQTHISTTIFAGTMFATLTILWQVLRINRQVNTLQERVDNLQHRDQVLQREIKELSVLHSVAVAATEATSEDELISRATELIGATLYPDSFGILLLDPMTQQLIPHPSYFIEPHLKPITPVKVGKGVIGAVVIDGQPRRVADVRQFPGYIETDARVRSELCVPLHIGGETIGVVNAESYKRYAFGENDERFLIIFAGQLATAIARLRGMEATHEQAQQIATIYDVGRQVTSILSLDQMLPEVARLIEETLHTYNVEIGLLENDVLVFRAGRGGYAYNVEGPHYGPNVSLGEGITGTVAATGELILATDVDKSPHYAYFDALPHVKAELCVPLTVRGKVIGIIDVKSDRIGGVGLKDAEFLKILAAQVSVAVQNAQHFSVLQERTRELVGLYEMAIATTSVLEPEQLFQRIYEQIQRLMHPDVCIAALTVGNSDNLTLALSMEQGKNLNMQSNGIIPIYNSGLIGWVLETQEMLSIDDLQTDPVPTAPRLSPNARSWIGVPLLTRDHAIGVLCVQSYTPNAFSPDQHRFLQSAARQVTIAVENARLYRSALDTADRFEILRQASQEILSAGLNPTRVYGAIHKATQKLMPSEAFVITQLDEITQQIFLVYAVDKTGLQEHNPVPLGEGLSSHVIMTGTPVLASDISQLNELDAIHFGDPESIRSVLAVPLRIGGKIYGMLSAQSYQANAHTHQDQSMLEMLGAYAAAALENARLFEAEHQRNIELEALRLASLNLTSSLEAKEVLQLILQSTLSMVHAEDAHIFLYDGKRLSFGAARWLDQALAKPFSNPRPEGATYTVARSGEALVIPATKGHPMFIDTPWDSAIASFPLLIGELVVGVMNVAYHQPHNFDENELRSLRLLADQAAIAIRNAELFESTQRQLQELKLLYSLALSGAEATDEEQLIKHATELIGQTLYPDNFGVLLLNDTHDRLSLHGSYQCKIVTLHSQVIPIGHGITGKVAQHGIPIRAPDIRNEPSALRLNEDMRAELCVPLKVGQRIIGVINVESHIIGNFTEDDERLLMTVANQLATGIEKARLFAEITRALDREQRLNEIARTISGALDMPTILNNVLRLATELIGADSAVLIMLSEEEDALPQPYVYNMPGGGQNLSLSKETGITWHIIESNKSLVLSNYMEHPKALDVIKDIGAHAYIGVPVAVGGKTIGALQLFSSSSDVRFTQRDLGLIESIGLQTGIAIQNARHFAQASQRAAELASALTRLEELDQLKSEFIQNVSHELRTPLAIVRGYIELLTDGTLGDINPEQIDPINIISRRVDMLTHIVEDLTIILEVEGDRMRWEEIDIHAMTMASVSDFQMTVETAGLRLVSTIDPDTQPVYGDSVKLRRTLDNLIGNALKFTPNGGSITVRLIELGESVLIQVADTGIGIPRDKLERVFERFYQVDGSSRRRYGGTGLGLSLVKEITEAHNGSVSVESEENKGTTFSVEIPHGSPEYIRHKKKREHLLVTPPAD